MKKLVASGLLAVALLATSQQQASAWINARFGIGMNWEFSSGNNCLLGGLWSNGQAPGPMNFQPHWANGGDCYVGGFGHPGHAAAPYAAPYQYAAQPYAAPYQYAAQPYANPYQLTSYPGYYQPMGYSGTGLGYYYTPGR